MTIYCYILLGLAFASAASAVASHQPDDFTQTCLGFCVLLPLIGRILGWW